MMPDLHLTCEKNYQHHWRICAMQVGLDKNFPTSKWALVQNDMQLLLNMQVLLHLWIWSSSIRAIIKHSVLGSELCTQLHVHAIYLFLRSFNSTEHFKQLSIMYYGCNPVIGSLFEVFEEFIYKLVYWYELVFYTPSD